MPEIKQNEQWQQQLFVSFYKINYCFFQKHKEPTSFALTNTHGHIYSYEQVHKWIEAVKTSFLWNVLGDKGMVFHPIMEQQDTNLTAPRGKPCRININTEACNSRVITPVQGESIKCTEDFIQIYLWGGDTQPSFTTGTGTCCFILASSEWR